MEHAPRKSSFTPRRFIFGKRTKGTHWTGHCVGRRMLENAWRRRKCFFSEIKPVRHALTAFILVTLMAEMIKLLSYTQCLKTGFQPSWNRGILIKTNRLILSGKYWIFIRTITRSKHIHTHICTYTHTYMILKYSDFLDLKIGVIFSLHCVFVA